MSYFIYIDESQDQDLYIYSALLVPFSSWNDVFGRVLSHRRALKKTDGLFVRYEWHAQEFVSGRGRIADRIVGKHRRCQIYLRTLELMAELPRTRLINALGPKKKRIWIFERLLNRINRFLQSEQAYGTLVCDAGNEIEQTRILRRLRAYNPIPSHYGGWGPTQASHRNLPIDRIIEDPSFRRSHESHFVQLVDFSAHALLQRERPIPSKMKYGLHKAFDRLQPILVQEASSGDPDGIIRIS